jgi:hypothetical protein
MAKNRSDVIKHSALHSTWRFEMDERGTAEE